MTNSELLIPMLIIFVFVAQNQIFITFQALVHVLYGYLAIINIAYFFASSCRHKLLAGHRP